VEKEYTAFIYNLYEFNSLPFGLCNAHSTSPNLTDRVFEEMKWKEAIDYLDDISIFSFFYI